MKEINANEIGKKLKEKGFAHECPMCHTTSLRELMDKSVIMPAGRAIIIENRPTNQVDGMECAVIRCLNCGHVEFFDLAALLMRE